MSQPAESSAPVPSMQGRFALYETPDGGRVLAYKLDGEEESRRVAIPAAIIRLMLAQQNGEKISPMQIMKTVMGSGN